MNLDRSSSKLHAHRLKRIQELEAAAASRNEKYNLLMVRVAELEAWQTNISQMIQSAAMDGESIIPRQIVDLTYDRW